ncbi:MAG: hypothetical protein HN702_05900 [Flavobacteriales bacterium]|nr:hypothetical protein [Flavobacteriales bacterium]
MKRRKFIRDLGLGTAATIGVPYLLPSGRLFAASGARKANHVVFCLFAGGVRNLESVHKNDGNLMPYTLKGTEGISSDIISGINFVPPNTSGITLQEQGTLYKEFRMKYGPTGHYGAHATAMTGVYTGENLNINANPQYPTIFELYRKHNSPSMSAKNTWWVSNSLGAYAHLNYSTYAGYGPDYGANYIQPASIISQKGFDNLGNSRIYNNTEEEKIKALRGFCDAHFSSQYNGAANSITNTEEDKIEIESFINQCFIEAAAGQFNDPWSIGGGLYNNDMQTVHFAEKIIQEYKPELLVVNMQDVDIAHSNFTLYANNIQKADYALAHLWNIIQNTTGMADDTILIAMPEHGRNQDGNGLYDSYGREALDHTNDDYSREIFSLILGPSGVVVQDQVFSQEKGESIDIVPTIANILGFDNDVPGGLLSGNVLTESFY